MILLYDEKWLQEFDGNIDPNTVNFKELANSLEKYTSQYVYKYKTNIKNFNIIKIKIMNNNIPHLLGLSHNHHVGLPSYYSQAVFEGLKNDWTLEKIKKADQGWFSKNKDKIIGVLFLYQFMHIQNCKVYTTINSKSKNKRLKRDNIYFIIFKYPNNQSYSIELTLENQNRNSISNTFVPRSLKLNDRIEKDCSEAKFTLISRNRIKSKKISYIPWKT